jgi:hypothetical protein
VLTVLQNVDALYWQASGEPGESVRAVRVDSHAVCVFNATPLEKYERYRLCIEQWRQQRSGTPDIAPTFCNLVYALLRFLNIDENASPPEARLVGELFPEVVSIAGVENLSEVLRRPQRAAFSTGPATRQLGEDEVTNARERLRRAGCCYLPALNMLVVLKFEISWVAEEAARFVCCAGWAESGLDSSHPSGEKAFYHACLQNALIEYGSRVLYPGHQPMREHELYALYSKERQECKRPPGLTHRDYMRLVDFVLLHRDFECNARRYRFVPELIREGRAYSAERFALVTQWLGRLLGSELYEAYLRGSVTKHSVRGLFLRRPEKPKAAYFRLVHLCRRERRLAA